MSEETLGHGMTNRELAAIQTGNSHCDILVREAVAAERERCANLVPTNWLDPLLTGKDAPKHPLDNRGVEALLRGIQNRIRNQEE